MTDKKPAEECDRGAIEVPYQTVASGACIVQNWQSRKYINQPLVDTFPPSETLMNDAELNKAASIAMAYNRCINKMSIFAPFEASNKGEACSLAWLMSCTPYASSMDEIHYAATALAYVTHLEQEGPVVEELYRKLVLRTDELVHVCEVEQALGCRWGEIDVVIDGHPQRIDPYFWKMLETMVRDSTVEYLTRLDGTLCNLDGLDLMQFSNSTALAMERTRRLVTHYLSNALLNRDTTTERLVVMLMRLRDEALKDQVEASKRLVQEQIRGIRALAALAAAPTDKLDEKMQELESDILLLFPNAPSALKEHFIDHKISLMELSAVFVPYTNGLIDSRTTVPPASLGVRITILAQWLDRCRDAVSDACVATIATLQRVADRPLKAYEWAGVQLCLADPTDARTREAPPSAIATWRPPGHIGPDDEPRVVVATQQNGTALRVARFFGILLDQAKLGLLPPMKLRASWVLPIISRFTAENQVARGHYVAMRLRPLADACGVLWPEHVQGAASKRPQAHVDVLQHPCDKRRAPSPTFSDVGSGHAVTTPSTLGAPMAADPSLGRVPAALLRDHAILHALCMCIQQRKGSQSIRIPLQEISTTVQSLCPLMREHKTASVTQAVRYVCTAAINRATAKMQTEGVSHVIEYSSVRDCSGDRRVGGVVCEGEGGAYFLNYASWVVMQMKFNGTAFCNVWHASRSSQSRARSRGASGKMPKSV